MSEATRKLKCPGCGKDFIIEISIREATPTGLTWDQALEPFSQEARQNLRVSLERDHVLFKPRMWLDKALFNDALGTVKQLGGRYDKDRQCFVVPLSSYQGKER